MRRVYLDHNATTPVRPEVAEVMLPYLRETFGNASSMHAFGREARRGVEKAREQVAHALGADPKEIVFTSGGTEADAMALLGPSFSAAAEARRKVVVSAIEHPAVLETAHFLGKRGFEAVFLPVDEGGIVDMETFRREVDEKTLVVSVMMANNEVGAIQPVAEMAAHARSVGALFHTDCVQSFGKIPVKVQEIGADMVSVSAHKIYGPKGVGALWLRKGLKLEGLFHGGHQERMIRPGTENVPGIVGFGVAAELAEQDLAQGRTAAIATLRDELEQRILEKVPHARVNGDRERRVPNTTNISFSFVEGEGLLLALDAKGLALSTGSACSSGSLEPSHVLMAMKVPIALAHGSLRFSLGSGTTAEDVAYAADAVAEVVARLRSMSPLYEDFLAGKEIPEADACDLHHHHDIPEE